MAKLTTKESDQIIYDLVNPMIITLSNKLGYVVPVYYPAMRVTADKVYCEFFRSTADREQLGISEGDGYISVAEIRFMIHATERPNDYELCADTADEIVDGLSRTRCGDLVINNCRWEDTEYREGRRIFTVIINYEYES